MGTAGSEDIPVLTDVVDADAPGRVVQESPLLGELEARLAAAIHEHADELVHAACRELEAVLLEQVSDRLREALPALISDVVARSFESPPRAS
jgi:hypothetical protein